MKLCLFLALATVVKSVFAQNDDITIPNPDTICSIFQNSSVSEKCVEQLEIVCANSTLIWTIFDASAKFLYTGLSFSTRMEHGNFDQCFSVDHSYSGGRILGEYCTIGLIIPDIINNSTDYEDLFKLAMCRPNGCSAADFNAIAFSTQQDGQGLFVDGLCQTKETTSSYSSGDIAVVALFGLFGLLMLMSTLYDFYLQKSGLKSSHPLYLAFSVVTNGKKLLHTSRHSQSKEQIEVFHGMRAISMIWIIAGHGYVAWTYVPVSNAQVVANWLDNISSFYITAGPLAVDTFFFMSGFLMAFQYFKRTKAVKVQIVEVPSMIIHRYLRLTPAMLMMYLVTITFFVHLGSGPLWILANDALRTPCKTYWWRFFLYIQNYFDFDDTCLPQTWYLSADMQLFIISPLIIIPLTVILKKFGFKSSMWALVLMNIIWTIMPMVLKLVFREYTNEYDTHSRLIVFFSGVMMGFFMRQKIDKPFLYMVHEATRSTMNLSIWVVVLLGMLALVVCYQDQLVNRSFESIQVFQSLMRPAWCIGLSWITYSCYHSKGGLINWILCRPIFQILGRLTYCIYLVHVSVIVATVGTARTKWHYSEYNAFYQFCGHYAASVIVAAFWTLAFESPLIVVEKYIFGGARPAKEDHAQRNGSVEEGPTQNGGKV